MRGNSERDGWTNTPESQRLFIEAMADMWDSKADRHRWSTLARDLAFDHLGMSQQQFDALAERYGINDAG